MLSSQPWPPGALWTSGVGAALWGGIRPEALVALVLCTGHLYVRLDFSACLSPLETLHRTGEEIYGEFMGIAWAGEECLCLE